jgi:hypothetical protein
MSRDGKTQTRRQPLGEWTIKQEQTRQEWNWYVDTATGELLSREGTHFHVHNATTKVTHFHQERDRTINRLPTTALPISVNNFQTAKIPLTITYAGNEQGIPTQRTFEEHMDTLED